MTQVCSNRHIRKDFKTQTLIDYHNTKENQVSTYTGPLCGMCEVKGEPVVMHCGSCDQFICYRCQEIHGRMKATNSHTVIPLTELNGLYSEYIKILQIKKKDLRKTSDEITSAFTRLVLDEEDQIKQVDQHINAIRKSIHQNIKAANSSVKEILRNKKEINRNDLKNTQTKLHLLSEVIEINDYATLKTFESRVKEDMHLVLREKHITQWHVDPNWNSPVTLKLRHVNPDSLVEVILPQSISPTINTLEMPKIEQLLETDFSILTHSAFVYQKYVKVCEPVQRMRMIDGNLYIAVGESGIRVNNTDLETVKTFKSTKLKYMTSVDWCELTDDLVVACGGNTGQGLHQLTLEGDYVACLSPHSRFSDVCCQNGKVYGLNYDECMIKVFGKDKQNTWASFPMEQIKLEYSNGNQFDKMAVIGDNVFVSSCIDNCVDVYSASSGAYKRQLGFYGLNGPVLGDVDAYGHVVVCNYWTHSVKTYSETKGSQAVPLPWVFGTYPAAIALNRDGTTIYVATHAPQTIMKFETSY